MMYINANINGRWWNIELTDDEIERVKIESLKTNIEMAKEIHEELKNVLPPEVIAGIVSNATQHYIYRLENYAILKQRGIIEDENAAKKQCNEDDAWK